MTDLVTQHELVCEVGGKLGAKLADTAAATFPLAGDDVPARARGIAAQEFLNLFEAQPDLRHVALQVRSAGTMRLRCLTASSLARRIFGVVIKRSSFLRDGKAEQKMVPVRPPAAQC
jgi:hypothetical protein